MGVVVTTVAVIGVAGVASSSPLELRASGEIKDVAVVVVVEASIGMVRSSSWKMMVRHDELRSIFEITHRRLEVFSSPDHAEAGPL